MKKCPNCNMIVANQAIRCPKCKYEFTEMDSKESSYIDGYGTVASNEATAQIPQYQSANLDTDGTKNSALGIISIVCSLLYCTYILGFIFGAIEILRNNGRKKTCACAGVVLSTMIQLFLTVSTFYTRSVQPVSRFASLDDGETQMRSIFVVLSVFMVVASIFLLVKVRKGTEQTYSRSINYNSSPNTNNNQVNHFSKPGKQSACNSTPKSANNNPLPGGGRERIITNENLAELLIQSKIYEGVNPNNEVVFAEQVQSRMRALLSLNRVSANVSAGSARCGNIRHPLIEIWNEEYGSIGLMINKNMIQVIRLRFGKVTEMMYRQEQLRNASAGYKTASKWNAAGTASSVVGMGSALFREHDAFNPFDGCGVGGCSAILGTFNCLSGISKSSKAKRMKKEADRIQYDPSNLAFEQAWENDVLKCINQI